MTGFVNKLFRLRPGEAGLFFTLGILLLANSLARQTAGIVAISGFLDDGGVNQFLIVLAIDYLIVLLMGGLQSLIIDKFDRIKLVTGLSFGFALVFVVLRLLFTFRVPGWLNYAIMYIVAEQQLIFFPLFFWVLANDVFDMAQAKRLFPVIASWSFVGKLLGIGVSYISPGLFERLSIPAEEILIFNVLIYLLAYGVAILGLRHVKIRQTVQKVETIQETLSEGWGFIKEVLSFRNLMIAIVALAIADTIIEFRFLVVTDAAFTSAASYQQFYSLYRLGATLLAFFVQMAFTSRIIDKIGLKNSFFFFPVIILMGTGSMIAFPGLITAIGTMILTKLARETVDESARKSFEALVPEERRGRVSVFMGSYLPAVGTILGCVLAGIVVFLLAGWIGENSFYIYLGIVVLAGIAALWAIFNMRKTYDSSLFNWRIKRRQRGSSVIDKLDF
nr:hypothetical protein [Anaerolineae bacterium]